MPAYPTSATTPDVLEYDRALAAGLSTARAARWVAYLRMCAAEGREPLSLAQAAAQPLTVTERERVLTDAGIDPWPAAAEQEGPR